MTLGDILSAAYEELAYQASPASAVTTRITRYINEGIRAIVIEPGLARLADSDGALTFASVASQARYVLPEAVARLQGIHDTTNDLTLSAMDIGEYRRLDPDAASDSGTPVRYAPIGRVAVAVQPSAATELFVDSTSATDTNNAYVEGITTGGYLRTATVKMTGTTEVSLSSAVTTFIEVTDFYLDAAAVGTVTLWQGTPGPPIVLGTELARITIGAKRPRYYGFALWPTPSAAVTYNVDYRRELVDLANTTDEPPLPTDAHPMLIAYAVMRESELKKDQPLYMQAKDRYARFLSRLKYSTQTGPDELPVAGRRGLVGHSRLGAWFPADYWTR